MAAGTADREGALVAGTESQPPARTRRSTTEVRSRVKAAGRAAFAEHGYAAASTKDIAARADVAEVLIFRHFGSKAGLFEEAVLETFEQFVDDYAVRWSEHTVHSDWTEREVAKQYITMLYEFLESNRQLLVALLSAEAHHESTAERLGGLFARLEAIVEEATEEFGFARPRAGMTVRLTFGMVMSTVIHADVLFPARRKPSKRVLIDELTNYVLYGIAH